MKKNIRYGTHRPASFKAVIPGDVDSQNPVDDTSLFSASSGDIVKLVVECVSMEGPYSRCDLPLRRSSAVVCLHCSHSDCCRRDDLRVERTSTQSPDGVCLYFEQSVVLSKTCPSDRSLSNRRHRLRTWMSTRDSSSLRSHCC